MHTDSYFSARKRTVSADAAPAAIVSADAVPTGPAAADARASALRASEPQRGRALVLGGGGSTGNAWLIGVLAGLADAGVDVATADLTIGTSAGATAAAQLGGATPAELYAAVIDAAPADPAGATAPAAPAVAGVAGPAAPAPEAGRSAGFPGGAAAHLERLRAIIDASHDLADLRRRVGAAALGRTEGHAVNEPGTGSPIGEGPTAESREAERRDADRREADRSARWREVVAARLPRQEWPDREVILTAVDARTGAPVLLDRASGIALADAVAASCAGGGFAHRVGDLRLIDGGYRVNAENADLAAGFERVLVLSPLSGRSLHPAAWGTRLAGQVSELRAQGSRVETVFPATAAEHLFGANAMRATLRPEAARAGFVQGREIAERIAALWR